MLVKPYDNVKKRSRLIKITATVLSVAKSGVTPVYRERNRSKYSQRYGMQVAAHHGDEGMQRAIIGGVKR
jgi:hypothetical protein